MSANKWKEMQEQLRMTMKKEISLMREVLANMHREEMNILAQEPCNPEELIQERSQLFEKLNYLKISRLDLIRQLTDLLPFSKKNKPFDHLMAIDAEGYSELQLLQDQFNALAERTHFQNERNIFLEQAKHQLSMSTASTPSLKLRPKKNVTTICENRPET